jgi:retron-type reverse transcriptase
VDGVTIEQFGQDLQGNLYKLWNRMSSGSYFPPAVKGVEIPKAGGKGECAENLIRPGGRSYSVPAAA